METFSSQTQARQPHPRPALRDGPAGSQRRVHSRRATSAVRSPRDRRLRASGKGLWRRVARKRPRYVHLFQLCLSISCAASLFPLAKNDPGASFSCSVR